MLSQSLVVAVVVLRIEGPISDTFLDSVEGVWEKCGVPSANGKARKAEMRSAGDARRVEVASHLQGLCHPDPCINTKRISPSFNSRRIL